MAYRTRKDYLKIYALLWGGGAFILGVIITMTQSPVEVSGFGGAVERWLSMHGLHRKQGTRITSTSLSIAPVLVNAIGVLLVTNSMYGAQSDEEFVHFGGATVIAYVITGIAAIAFTDAFPTISGALILIVLVLISLWIGSILIGKMPLPIIGIVSLGGIFLVGIGFIAGFGIVLSIAVPLAKPAVIGAVLAIIPMWFSKNSDF